MTEFTPELRPVPARDLRAAMGAFATGVTVVTSLDATGAPVGTTANAVTSLSLDPPLVLACFGRSSRTLAALRRHGAFAINVLGAHHRELSAAFARSGDPAAWDGVRHEPGATGSPRLPDALATVECVLERLVDGGDHEIAIGRVVGADVAAGDREPLLFFRGAHARLADAPPAAVECALPTRRGGFRAVALSRAGGPITVALVHGDPGAVRHPLVAAHPGCLLGEAFGSTLCDCRAALDRSFDAIVAEGAGVVLYAKPEASPAEGCAATRPFDAATATGLLRRLGVSAPRLGAHPPGLAAELQRLGIEVHVELREAA
ncbi:MAG TPA: flavin reductase [Capillimicrobium sp.]|nr:flavin reductase [Capillimicrobium sp.]